MHVSFRGDEGFLAVIRCTGERLRRRMVDRATVRWTCASAACAVIVAASVPLVGCNTDVGDQACLPDSQYDDKDDDCPFGAPGGPKLQADNGCPPIAINAAGPNCGKTWESDVFPMFQRDPPTSPSGGACTRATCHAAGSPGGTRITIPNDAAQAFNNLKEYSPAGRPYVSDIQGVKQTSFILCNLQGLPGGGRQMPEPASLLSAADLQLVIDWAECGFPRGPGGTATGSGGGGAGGAGGTAGAGGGL
jgi:hypothetical protein